MMDTIFKIRVVSNGFSAAHKAQILVIKNRSIMGGDSSFVHEGGRALGLLPGARLPLRLNCVERSVYARKDAAPYVSFASAQIFPAGILGPAHSVLTSGKLRTRPHG